MFTLLTFTHYCIVFVIFTVYKAEFALSAEIPPVRNEKKGGVHELEGDFCRL